MPEAAPVKLRVRVKVKVKVKVRVRIGAFPLSIDTQRHTQIHSLSLTHSRTHSLTDTHTLSLPYTHASPSDLHGAEKGVA